MFNIEKTMEQSSIGFAKHQLIYDKNGKPQDYIFLSINPTFERLTGLKREALINRRVSEVMPKILQNDFDWIGYFGKVVKDGERKFFEQYSAPLDKWYRVEVFSCEKDYFTTLFTDITNERELIHASKAFLNDGQTSNTFEQITQQMKRITGANYVALNIFLEDGESFRTVAIAGIPGVLQRTAQILGFNPQNKVWAPDPHRMALIRDQSVTTLDYLHELTSYVLPKTGIQLLEKTFNLGKTVVIKSTCGEKIIGDFTLMFSKRNDLQNENEAIIYADMVGMLIEKRKGQQKLAEKEGQLRESQQRYQSIAEDTPAMICRSLPDTSIVYANKAYCDFFQRKLESLIGQTFMDLIPKDQHESIRAALSQLTPKSPSITHEHQVFSPSGSGICWQRWTISGLFDAAGKIISYQSINRYGYHRGTKSKKQFKDDIRQYAGSGFCHRYGWKLSLCWRFSHNIGI